MFLLFGAIDVKSHLFFGIFKDLFNFKDGQGVAFEGEENAFACLNVVFGYLFVGDIIDNRDAI